ncbi:MAG TPA: polysaccharide deacetylase family protein [Parafilimonas sp.]|nr:polysaccharide deacetylase family protein [Parafilimonas sp.]
MLNFRNTNINFSLLLAVTIGLCFSYHITFWSIAVVLFIYSLIVFYGCYFIQANFFIKTLCSGHTEKKEVAISFDDGPVKNYTPQVLQVLQQHNIKAAFFCIGNRIRYNKDLLKRVHDEGHIIGNHSFTHSAWFDLFSHKRMSDELVMTDDAIQSITGCKPHLFRPPYGVTNPNLRRAIINGNYIPVGWSVRSYDTIIKDEKKLLRRVTRNIKPGDIFLFHDTRKTTLNILPTFIQHLQQKGYDIVRLDKLLHVNAYE